MSKNTTGKMLLFLNNAAVVSKRPLRSVAPNVSIWIIN